MNLIKKIALMTLIAGFAFGCGEKSGPTINFIFSGSTPDPSLQYVLFKVASVPRDSDGKMPDVDKDGQGDTYVFPENCVETSGSLTPTCGYNPGNTTFTLKDIPLNFKYRVIVFFKDGAGKLLYLGSSDSFTNIATTGTVTINITDCSLNPSLCT